MMKAWFGGGDDEPPTNKKSTNKKEEKRRVDEEEEIPIITDAVVVRAEDATPPPPMNPNHVAPAAPAPAAPPNTTMTPYYQGAQFSKPVTFHNMGRNPVGLLCPYCKRQTITVVQDMMGMGTLVAVFILALLFWPICWLPLCIPSCKRTHHFCGRPECRQRIGETSVCA